MNNSLALLLQAYSLEIRKILSYRVDFWVDFFSKTLVKIVLAYFLWSAIYSISSQGEIGGYSFLTMMFYFVITPLIDHIVRGKEHGYASVEIYDGTLTRYLLYPMSFFSFKYLSHLALATAGFFKFFVILTLFILFFGIPEDVNLNTQSILLGLFATLVSSLVFFTIAMTLELTAFWADNVWSLIVMVRFMISILGGGMIPLSLFPESISQILYFTPFPYMISFPVLTTMGKMDLTQWISNLGILFSWGLFFMMVFAVVWKRGLKKFTGVGI